MSTKYAEARFETGAPGTELVAPGGFSTKQLYIPATSFAIDPDPTALDRGDEMRGINEPVSHVIEQCAPSFTIATRMYPDLAAFFLKALLGAPVTTAGNGVITDLSGTIIPVGATRHDWTAPYGSTGAPQTVSFRLGLPDETNGAVFYNIRGATIQGIDFATPDTGGVTMSITGRANFMTTIADPSLTPAYESLTIEPFMKSNALLTYLASTAPVESLSLGVSCGKEHTRTFGGGSKFPDLIEFTDDLPAVTFEVAKRSLDVDDWNALLNATRFTFLGGWVHQDIIASAYPFKVLVQGPSSAASVMDGGEVEMLNRRRTPMSFNGRLSRETAASSVIEVVNATASYV